MDFALFIGRGEIVSLEELLKIVKAFYSRLLSKTVPNALSVDGSFSMYSAFVKHLWERYELLDVAAQKCRSVLKSVTEHLHQDERIDHFALFLGIKEEIAGPEAPLIYLRLLKELNMPIETLLGTGYKQEIDFEECYAKMVKYVDVKNALESL